METTLKKQSSRFHLSDKKKGIIVDVITYLFVALFVYTATDKFWRIDQFVEFMNTLAIIGPIGAFVAWVIPITEVGISILLLRPVTRRRGLIASSVLMMLFTIYLIYMKLTAEHLPCHCGGVISLMSWTQHIYFNIILIVLSVAPILFFTKLKIKDRLSV